jgi:CDP-glucose 4,6-dehydratase
MALLTGRRVWITGHTGFKGSWLAAWLASAGAEVHGFALDPPTKPSLFETIGLASRIRDVRGDVRDRERVARACDEAGPEVVFHLAAQALVRASYVEPVETFHTNVLGTVHVLDAVRRLGRPCVAVVVTSDKCYEERPAGTLLREDDPMGGHDPYAASKGAAELVTASWRRSFFPEDRFDEHRVALATVRAGNVIGGGDWAPDRIVPDIVRALAAGSPVGLRNPAAVRPWQHVLDALSGYVLLAERMLAEGPRGLAEGWNFGPDPGDRIDVERLTERALAAWGSGTWSRVDEARPPHEAGFLALDTGKARRRLGWRPRWDVGKAIDETIAWYAAHRDGRDMAAFTEGQIAAYLGAAA